MKITVLLPALLLACGLCSAETLKLRSGAEVQGELVSMDKQAVSLDGGRSLPRADVAEIRFGAAAARGAAGSGQASSAGDLFARAAALARAFPGVNGVKLLSSISYTLNPDGTVTTRDHEVHQVLKESLKQRWGQVIECAEEGRERVTITMATVYNPDGKAYPLDPSQIKTSKPQRAGSEFFVSGSVCTQYALPNVQNGSIIEYETVTETYNPFRKDFFFPVGYFQDTEGPVARAEMSVTVPAGTEFHYSARNFGAFGSPEPEVRRSTGAVAYSWALQNVPPMSAEPAMPPYVDVAPIVRGSVFKDWDRIFDWMGSMHRERSEASPELKQFTLDLVKDCRTDEEKAAKIYHYVQKEIRYIAVKVGVASGWGGYDANLTWKRRYGCCIDKSLLLVAMLKAAGINASTVILNTNNAYETDFSVPQIGFNHAITVADIGGRQVFLDSTGYDYAYPQIPESDRGVRVLNMFAKRIDEVPVPAPADNGNTNTYAIKLSSTGAALVDETMRYTGSVEGGVRSYYRSMKKEEQKQVFQSLSKAAAPSAVLLSYEVNNAETLEKPFSAGLKYSVADYPQRAGDILIVKLPDFEIPSGYTREVSLGKRQYPVKYSSSLGLYREYSLKLPPGCEVVSLPEKVSFGGKYAAFRAGCSMASASEVRCSVAWERSARRVPPEDYADYKSFVEKAASYSKTQLFLREKAAAAKGK